MCQLSLRVPLCPRRQVESTIWTAEVELEPLADAAAVEEVLAWQATDCQRLRLRAILRPILKCLEADTTLTAVTAGRRRRLHGRQRTAKHPASFDMRRRILAPVHCRRQDRTGWDAMRWNGGAFG